VTPLPTDPALLMVHAEAFVAHRMRRLKQAEIRLHAAIGALETARLELEEATAVLSLSLGLRAQEMEGEAAA